MTRTKTEIMLLQETHEPENKKVINNLYSWYYSGGKKASNTTESE